MKKLLFLLSVTLCTCHASAQVKVGVEAGANLSHYLVSGSKYAEHVEDMKVGYQFGVSVDYLMGRHWMLMSGLYLQHTQSKMDLGDGTYKNTFFKNAEIEVNNLIVPLKLGYQFNLSDKFSLIPSVGAYASYGFNAGKCSLQTVCQNEQDRDVYIKDATWKPMDGYSHTDGVMEKRLDPFRKWSYGGMAGLKAVVNDHYTISFDYSVGIKEVQKQNGLRDSNFQLSVGYRF